MNTEVIGNINIALVWGIAAIRLDLRHRLLYAGTPGSRWTRWPRNYSMKFETETGE